MDLSRKIYAIYASENDASRLHLMRYLKQLEKDFDVSIWHDDPIYPGQQWKPQNESRLNQADIFLLLVSDAFMHSEFVKQQEFKKVIDKYKDGSSIVIPVILDNCPWDIDFKSDDYDFNFKELQVLPEKRKPISDLDSADAAYKDIAEYVKMVVGSITENLDQKKSGENLEKKATNANLEDQLTIRFSEEGEAQGLDDEETGSTKEIADDRLVEEERRQREEAGAKSKAELELRLKEDAQAKKRAEEESLQYLAEDADRDAGETQQENYPITKKRILVGSIVAVVVAIFAFLAINTTSKEDTPPLPRNNPIGVKDSVASEKVGIDSSKTGNSFSSLGIGDIYGGGIIFSIDHTTQTGKIAHLEDVGPMPWKTAMEIHEHLGEKWRLPTLKELELMYHTIGQGATNSGQFADELYWSATPYDDHQARLLRFRDGNASYHYNKNLAHRKFHVRAIRDFGH